MMSSTWVSVHADAPPVGSVEVRTLPPLSNATHSERDGHATPSMRGALGSATVVLIHADRPAPGFVEVNTVEFATATQNDGDGHDTAWRVNGPFTPARLQALAPPVGLVEVRRSEEHT